MHQTTALDEVKKEYAHYFAALEQHPRLLIGQTVPAIGKEGNETLRDASDAKDWQEAVKSVLVREVQSRAEKSMENDSDFMTTVHSSIEMFQNNHDLVPGSLTFDTDLAKRFVAFAKPYELRVEGKLQGYTIPVQPIIDQLRTQLVAERASSAPTAAGAPSSKAAPPAAEATSAPPPPQEGIPSKAGTSGDDENDFSALFGTIGLPDLRI